MVGLPLEDRWRCNNGSLMVLGTLFELLPIGRLARSDSESQPVAYPLPQKGCHFRIAHKPSGCSAGEVFPKLCLKDPVPEVAVNRFLELLGGQFGANDPLGEKRDIG